MIHESSTNIAEVIPYKTFKEKNRIIAAELQKDRYIETWDKLIYSARKWKARKKKGEINNGKSYRSNNISSKNTNIFSSMDRWNINNTKSQEE